MDWNAPLAEFTKEIGLGQASHLCRLPERGFLRHEQTDGKMERRGLWREARIEGRWQCQFHGSTMLGFATVCKVAKSIPDFRFQYFNFKFPPTTLLNRFIRPVVSRVVVAPITYRA
jgi:hypothetical protein